MIKAILMTELTSEISMKYEVKCTVDAETDAVENIVIEQAIALPQDRVLTDDELRIIFAHRHNVQIYLDSVYRYKLSYLVIVHDVRVHLATTKPLSLINYGDLHESQVHLPN